MIGNRALDAHERETRLNREAESAHVRKTMWDGNNGPDDDMGDQTILGDVTNPAPIVIQGGSNGGGNSLLTLALGAILGGGGIVLGQMLTKPIGVETPAIVKPTDNDTTTTIGLGKLEDYFGASK